MVEMICLLHGEGMYVQFWLKNKLVEERLGYVCSYVKIGEIIDLIEVDIWRLEIGESNLEETIFVGENNNDMNINELEKWVVADCKLK